MPSGLILFNAHLLRVVPHISRRVCLEIMSDTAKLNDLIVRLTESQPKLSVSDLHTFINLYKCHIFPF